MRWSAPALKSPEQMEKHRGSIKVGMLLKRLNDHASGKNKMTTTQLRAADILLARSMPTLSSTEVTGKDGGPLKLDISADDRVTRLMQLLAVAKAKQG